MFTMNKKLNYIRPNLLNTSNINNNNNSNIINNNKFTLKEENYEKEILNSMKASLDSFLINLKTKSSSKEDIQNYYLTENEILNSMNIDLISPYQNLLQKNCNKNNFSKKKLLKRAYSSGEMPHPKNNKLLNNYTSNSYYDKNFNEITQNNNSIIYKDNNDNMNKSLIIKNYNIIPNMPYNYKIIEKNKNKRLDYPIKLINNTNINNLNNSQLEVNNISINQQKNNFEKVNKNLKLIKEKNNKKKALIHYISYIKNEIKKLKIKNNQNKLEIKEFYDFYSQLINNIFTKIIFYINNFEKTKIKNYNKEIKTRLTISNNQNKSLNKENQNLKEIINQYKKENDENKNYNKIIEDKNNNIFLLKKELESKNNTVNNLIKNEEENKKTIEENQKTIEGFKKIMKDVKITLGDYEYLQNEQKKYKEIYEKSKISKEEYDNKIKELNEKMIK